MLRGTFGKTAMALALALGLAACDGGDLTGPAGEGRLTLELTSADASAAGSTASALLAASSPALARVGLDRVASISVTLDSVQVHPLARDEDEEDEEAQEDQDGEEGQDGEADDDGTGSTQAQQQGSPDDPGPRGGWITVAADGQELDLLALPEEGLELGAADLPAGEYRGVRLFVSDATITFAEDVSFGGAGGQGQGGVFEAGTPYPLIIPSARQTGVKVPRLAFTVPEGGAETVTLGFDADASVRTVAAAGNGTIRMAPVLVGGSGPRGGPGGGNGGGPGGGPGS